MAEGFSEREQRQIRRDEVRERQEQESEHYMEKVKKDLERKAKELRDLREQMCETGSHITERSDRGENLREIENESVRSNASTIGEFLQESTRRSIRDLEERQELDEMERQMARNEKEDQKSQSLIQDSCGDKKQGSEGSRYSHHSSILIKDKVITKERDDDSTWIPDLGCVKHKSSVTHLKTQALIHRDSDLKGTKDGKPDRDIDVEIDKIRREQEEILSQHSYYESRSQRLKHYRIEEDKKKQLMLINEKRLKFEIEQKRKAEAELMKNIQQMEKEEQELNRRRVENEMKERELFEYRKQDEDMVKRLRLLREKQRLILERSQLKEEEKLMHVKSEWPHDAIGKVTDALPSSTPYRAIDRQYETKPEPFRARDSQYERKPEPYGARESQYDKVPDYNRARDSQLEKELDPYRPRHSTVKTEADSEHGTVKKVKESPDNDEAAKKMEEKLDNKHPLFKVGFPKVPSFNGKQFEQWKMEVNCLLRAQIYPDYAIAQAVRNSLKDDTRQILLTLKPTATTMDVLKKVEEVYGNIKTGDNLVHEFYSAKQKEKELVSAWGIRLETLFQQAVDKGELDEKKRNEKLKERFWRGLISEKLKIATRVSYESDDSFETLRMKARREEEEVELEKTEGSKQKPTNVNQQVNEEKDKTLKEMLERMKSLESELEKLRTQKDNRSYGNRWPSRGSFRGRNRGFRGRPQYDRQQDGAQHDSEKHQTGSTEKKKEGENKDTLN